MRLFCFVAFQHFAFFSILFGLYYYGSIHALPCTYVTILYYLTTKVEASEAIASAAARELEEESKLIVTEEHLLKRGQLEFTISTYPYDMRVHVYECTEFVGREEETEEMAPQWFKVGNGHLPPFQEMWPDDRYWFRSLLDERKPYFSGSFHFSDDDTIAEYILKENGNEVHVEPYSCHKS